jgi:hypothetical protein
VCLRVWKILAVTSFMLIVAALISSPAAAQWGNGYTYRRTITIDHTKVPNTDQTNFPVLISSTYSDLATTANGGSVTNANGYDIIFTSDAAGASPLSFEQELYSPTTGQIIYWVNLPTLSHTSDTVIYLFYGNSSVTTDQSNKTAVWDSNYAGVWHLPNGTTLSANDSTANANTGSIYYAGATTGEIGGAASFAGYNYIDVGNGSSLQITGTALTLEAWVYTTQSDPGLYYRIVVKEIGSNNNPYVTYGLYRDAGSNNVWFVLSDAIPDGLGGLSGGPLTMGGWTHLVATYDGSNAKIYVNGSLNNSAATNISIGSTGQPVVIGADTANDYEYFSGSIDEVRISNSTRSADWIAAEYNNQSSPSTFYTVGSANGNGGGGGSPPNISSLSSVLDAPGIPVTVIGTNFGSSQGSSTVTFHGLTAIPTNWSNTSIATTVPSGATTGYVVVTVGGVASNNELFVIVPTPIISSLSTASGVAGTPVTIQGANFGSSQGSSGITFNGVPAVVTSWSNTSVTANVPATATTGNVVVTAGGVASNGVAFAITGPTITGLSSLVGAVGDSVTLYGFNFGSTQASSTVTFNGIPATPTNWTNMSIVVPVPTGAATGPINLTVSGAQTSSAVFTVGSPDTLTGLSITSPSNGATVATPYAVVTGTISGTIGGIDPIVVTCNNSSARLVSTNFYCNTPLSAGVNSITVVATDSAGDTQTASLNVTLGMATPLSLQVTPPNVNMLVGGTQSFTAVDDQGTRRPDATWSVSDSTIASFVSGSPNMLMANAVGQVTVTATVSGISAQTTVTVLSGTSLPAGTVLWSAPPVSGFTVQQMVQAVPTADGPGLYSIESGSNNNMLVRAFRSTGEQMWQITLAGYIYGYGLSAVGDNFGGLLLVGSPNASTGVIVDLDRQSGAQVWQYAVSGYRLLSFGAVGLDGTIYAVENNTSGNGSATYVDSLNGVTGALQAKIELPQSWSYFHCPDETSSVYSGAFVGPAAVMPDGALYLEVFSQQEVEESNCEFAPQPFFFATDTQNLSLLRVSPDGAAGYYSLGPNTPGEVIPDGQGGVLATWTSANGPALADIGTTGTQTTFPISIGSMVLGDNNTAFATDGNSVVSFSVPGLQQLWTYTSTGGSLSFINATPAGGVLINDSQLGAIQLNSSGNANAPVGNLQGSVPLDNWSWVGLVSGELAATFDPDNSNGLSNALPQSALPSPSGTYGSRQPPLCAQNGNHCVLVPAKNVIITPAEPGMGVIARDITYGIYNLAQGNVLIPLYATSRKSTIEDVEAYSSSQDTSAFICSSTNPADATKSCFDYDHNYFVDTLYETNAGLTLSVTQTFYVDRTQVQVFWPVQYQNVWYWYGTPKPANLGKWPNPNPNQRASTPYNQLGAVQQLDSDPQLQATCQPLDGDTWLGTGGCLKMQH